MPLEPRLALTTGMPSLPARSNAEATADDVPDPLASSTRSGRMRAPGATPLTPIVSCAAAIVPETWVPWPFSVGGHVVARDEVPPAPVVDVAVAVVVDAVRLAPAAGLAGIRRDLPGKVGMRERDAGVDDRH